MLFTMHVDISFICLIKRKKFEHAHLGDIVFYYNSIIENI